MNNRTNMPSLLYSASGCLTGDALLLFVSDALPAGDHKKALKHLSECPLCADAVEGCRLWLAQCDATQTHNSAERPPNTAGTHDFANKHHVSQQGKVNPIAPSINLLHYKTNEINQRIKQRLFTHALHKSAEEKRLSYKPFIWISVAATILLFVTIGYVLWLQNEYANQQLARIRAEEMLMLDGQNTTDTLKISVPENKLLAMQEKKVINSQNALNVLPVDEEIEISDYTEVKNHEIGSPEEQPEKLNKTQVNDRNASLEIVNKNIQVKNEEEKPEHVFTLVDEMPSFPGGDAAHALFMKENLTYPLQAVENGVQGIVYVSFVVKSDGQITEITTLRGIGAGCDSEAIRVIKMMPRWTPGKLNGKKVDVFLTLPIIFKLAK